LIISYCVSGWCTFPFVRAERPTVYLTDASSDIIGIGKQYYWSARRDIRCCQNKYIAILSHYCRKLDICLICYNCCSW
jgi:hypothetical protein